MPKTITTADIMLKIVIAPIDAKNCTKYPDRKLAIKLLRNQTPIINEPKRNGASLVTIERPTGDKQSSPIV